MRAGWGAVATAGFGAEVPFAVAGKAFDRFGAAGGARACVARAAALHPPLRGSSFVEGLHAELEDHRLMRDQAPVPLDALAAALLAGAERAGVQASLERLPAALRTYVLSADFDAPAMAVLR